MNLKKNILFVINNLNVGGAEKALVNLLHKLDPNAFNIDLLLFKQEGAFLADIPKYVNVLPSPNNYRLFDSSFVKVLKTFNPFLIWNRYKFSKTMANASSSTEAEQLAWPYLSKALPPLEKEYDVAIGYLEKNPNYYIVEKVKAKKKIGYIHNDYIKLGLNKDIDKPYFEQLTCVCTISNQCLDTLCTVFPDMTNKFTMVPNVISVENLHKKSAEPIDEYFWNYSTINIVSVGRLEQQKGFELSIAVAKKLVAKKLNFKWYIIGEGSSRAELEGLIEQHQLEHHVILTGVQSNPIKFMNAASLIVQTSLFEGKSIVIDEAKMLCKPIVVTNYPTAKDQIQNGVNGLIVSFDPEEMADQIIELLNNKEMQGNFKHQLLQEQKVVLNSLETFNQLLQ